MKKLERYQKCVADRSQWNAIFEEVGKYVWPNARNIVKTVTNPDKGQVLTVDIADSTAIKAAKRMTAGIVSYLMPVGVRWFDLKPSGESDLKDREIMKRSSTATQSIHSAVWRSNYLREIFTYIRSLCVFGTACISVELINKKLVFKNYHIADIFFEENSKGEVDTVFRRMFYTARQMVQEFGLESLSEDVRNCLKEENFAKKFEVVHCVYPRTDYDTSKKDFSGMKFVSEYYEVANEHLLKSGGFKTIKYRIGKFELSYDELLGRSPAMDLLPDIKMLNDMRYTFVQSSELAAMPPILIEDDSVMGQPSVGPGDVISYRSGAKPPESMKTGANPQLTNEVMMMEREGIMEGFYNDIFITQGIHRNMTATESENRKEEGMVLLAPTICGIQKESFDPMIMDIYELLTEAKIIEDIGTDVDVVYQGRLALAMANMQTNATEITIAKWSPYQQFYPVLDNMNLDKAFVASSLNAGVPADLLLSEREVAANRKSDMEMKQAQQAAEVAATGSQAIKNVQGTALEGMI